MYRVHGVPLGAHYFNLPPNVRSFRRGANLRGLGALVQQGSAGAGGVGVLTIQDIGSAAVPAGWDPLGTALSTFAFPSGGPTPLPSTVGKWIVQNGAWVNLNASTSGTGSGSGSGSGGGGGTGTTGSTTSPLVIAGIDFGASYGPLPLWAWIAAGVGLYLFTGHSGGGRYSNPRRRSTRRRR